MSDEQPSFPLRREPISLRLPATSANLGPGFDAVALALALYLEMDAEPASTFAIEASGRSPEVCSALEGNLLLETYRALWTRYGPGQPQPLRLQVRNGIPLGMGCGSSAAARLAAVALASHFAGLGWNRDRMLAEAAALEHHPDNVAACCLGGLAVAAIAPPALFGGEGAPSLPIPSLTAESSRQRTELPPPNGEGSSIATREAGIAETAVAQGPTRPNKAPGDGVSDAITEPPRVCALSFAPPPGWYALLVLPQTSLATTVSRSVLPTSYPRAEVVVNLQNLALLVAAFAQGEGSLLHGATTDRLHQPFRGEACPLLPRLLPLAGSNGILSVTLSGAGSGVLLLLNSEALLPGAMVAVRSAATDPLLGALPIAELLPCSLVVTGAKLHPDPSSNYA